MLYLIPGVLFTLYLIDTIGVLINRKDRAALKIQEIFFEAKWTIYFLFLMITLFWPAMLLAAITRHRNDDV